MKRRTEITIEVDRELIINETKTLKSWCRTCGTYVSMATAGEAAEMTHTNEAAIYRMAEAGIIHVMSTSEVMLWICLDSLLALFNDGTNLELSKLLAGESQSSV